MSRSEQIERAAKFVVAFIDDKERGSTHWVSCEADHPLCLIRRLLSDALALPAEPDDRDRRIAELEAPK